MSASERISADPGHVKQSTPREYAVRFVFGGIVTAAVGIIGTAFGPTVAGLFLAFPAILPASMTLIERHQNADAAGVDALGAAAGSVGLIAYGLVIWALAARTAAPVSLVVALAVWFAVSVAVWWGAMRVRRARHAG